MNQSDYEKLKEKSWRGKLTAAELAELRSWLVEHPELAEDWQLEANLTEAMQRLLDAPVPSNFTTRVLQAIEHEGATQGRPRLPRWTWLLRSLVARTAVAVVLLGVGIFTYHEHRIAERRAELVQGVKMVAGVPSLPSPEILTNFDTIRKMGTTPGADPELLALLK